MPFSNAGKVEGQNIFKGSPGVPRFVANAIITPYDAWKQLIHENILRTITNYSNEESTRPGEEDFGLNLKELEVSIALQYARGVYEKNQQINFL